MVKNNEEEKVKKRKLATALKYSFEDASAPKVVAKGKGVVAENIIEKAEESDIPIYEDEKLSRQLYNLEIGQEIPPELYHVIAEVLVFISKLDKER